MIADPPLNAGAAHFRVADELPRVATTAVGAFGTVLGIVATDPADATEFPAALEAMAVKV